MAELLLVDNDEDIRSLLRLGLEEAGHTIREAANGLEALRAIETKIPDILITDLIMPSIPGDKLLRIIKAVPEWRSIPTIVISGVAAESPEDRAGIECDIYIAKGPIAQTIHYILDAIREFSTLVEMSKDRPLGLETIYSRHITRELLEINQIQQMVLDGISEGLSLITNGGRFVWVNETLCRMIDLREEHILGRSISEVLPTLKGEEFGTHPLGASREFTVEATGRIIRVEVMIPANGTPESALIWRNVTDRLLMEEQFENIVESTMDVIWTTNFEGYLTYVTASCEEILGFTRDDLLGRPLWANTPKDHQNQLEKQFRILITAAANGKAHIYSEGIWPFLHADGTVRRAQVRTSPLRDRGGRLIGLRGVLTDITKRERLEREREDLLHELHHRVRDNLQLIASLARLSEPDKLEGRIAAVSYVFDELYEEDSFADIEAAMLVYKVVSSAMSFSPCEHLPEINTENVIDRLSMRIAVPVAIILQETVTAIIAGDNGEPFCPDQIIVRLLQEERASTLLIGTDIDEFKDDAVPDPIDERSILSVTVDQLRGVCRCYTKGADRLYEISFPVS